MKCLLDTNVKQVKDVLEWSGRWKNEPIIRFSLIIVNYVLRFVCRITGFACIKLQCENNITTAQGYSVKQTELQHHNLTLPYFQRCFFSKQVLYTLKYSDEIIFMSKLPNIKILSWCWRSVWLTKCNSFQIICLIIVNPWFHTFQLNFYSTVHEKERARVFTNLFQCWLK